MRKKKKIERDIKGDLNAAQSETEKWKVRNQESEKN